jgi:hypothetical protein
VSTARIGPLRANSRRLGSTEIRILRGADDALKDGVLDALSTFPRRVTGFLRQPEWAAGSDRVDTQEIPGRNYADRPGVIVDEQMTHIVLQHEHCGVLDALVGRPATAVPSPLSTVGPSASPTSLPTASSTR